MESKKHTIDNLDIEPLSDEALELVGGGASSDGPVCCSCSGCSNNPQPTPVVVEVA